MKVNLKLLSKEQLLILLRKTNQKIVVDGKRYRKIYRLLLDELKRRRELNLKQAPEVIRRDINNQFGVINRTYFETLNHIDGEIYLNWKWPEL